jgi:Arc/MetJ-type ribon-helix-helix transcriptional regulator
MSTPGRRKALRALGKRRGSNTRRIAAGKKPILTNPRTGKREAVSPATFRKRTGASASKKKAQQRLKKRK